MKKSIRLTEQNLHRIIMESISKLLMEDNDNLEKWYRGYDSRYGSEKTHLLWITDDIDYAKEYGDRVEEIVIDCNKLKVGSIYDIDEIIGHELDYYDGPTEDEAKELLENGIDSYGFETNENMSYCLCLWSKASIVNRRELSQEEYDEIEGYE